MWRYDAGHGAASPEQLPKDLKLKWQLQFSKRQQVWDDPLNNDLMQYDRLFEPIVANKLVYLSFNDRDKVVAFDLPNSLLKLWYHLSEILASSNTFRTI